MNSDKRPARQSGNAMVYILLAIALLAALTMTMMRGSDTGGDDISKDEAELLATQVIGYAASAKQAVDQMMMSGTPVASLDFVTPNQASYNTGSNIHKVFHPAGGGLGYKAADPKLFTGTGPTPPKGWYLNRPNNIEWTPTTSQDVLLTAYQISRPVCESINKKITGNTTIPVVSDLPQYLIGTVGGAGAVADLTVAVCGACEGVPALCVTNTAQDSWAYYSIISAQ